MKKGFKHKAAALTFPNERKEGKMESWQGGYFWACPTSRSVDAGCVSQTSQRKH